MKTLSILLLIFCHKVSEFCFMQYCIELSTLKGKTQNHALYMAVHSLGYNVFIYLSYSPIHHINIYKLYTKMILKICPYQILENNQSNHFLKTILSIVNWLTSHVKIHVKTKIISFNLQCYQYNDDIS